MSVIKFSQALFIVLLTLLGVSEYTVKVYAKTPQQAKTDTSKVVRVIEPVPISSIGIETEKTLATLREYSKLLTVSQEERKIDSLIPGQLAKIEQIKADLDTENLEQMKIRFLQSMKSDFSAYKVDFDGWRKLYTSTIDKLYEIQGGLSDMNIRWSKTLELPRQDKLPEPVIDRIRSNIVEISLVSKEVGDRSNYLLTKQTELTSALLYIDEVLNSIGKVERSYKDRIIAFDIPPLWGLWSDGDTISTASQLSTMYIKHSQDLVKFKENYKANIFWHLFFFVLLLLLIYYLRNDVSKWSDEKRDEAVGYSLYLLQRPISAALLIALLSAGLIYPNAPKDVLDYYYVLLIIPLILLLPGLIKGIKPKYFYYIAVVFFLTQVADQFSEIIIVDRLLLLIINLITLAISIQLLREHKEIEEDDQKVNWRFSFFIIRVSVFLLSISLLANVVGNSFFAKDISRGTLIMLYGGIIISAGAIVLRGIFSLTIQQNSISQLNMIQNHADEVKKHVYRAIRFIAVIYWLYLTLKGYLIYESLYEWVANGLSRTWEIGSVALSIGSVLAFFLTLWISLALSRFIRFILQDEILTHFELPRGVPGAISMIVRLVLITLGFILAFGAAKIDMSNIAIVFGALGVGIGFGLQSIFNNLVSGLILAFERPAQIGDIIQIASLNLMGEVKDIGIRATVVRTFDGAEVIVPNGNLISNEMINWTLSDKVRRQEIIVGVAYGTDTKKVLEILEAVVSEQEGVRKVPVPTNLFLGFGDSSLNFSVRFWAPFDNGLVIKSEVGVAIDTAFKKEGIEIPFPQRDLHVKSIADKSELTRTTKKLPAAKRIAQAKPKKNEK